MVKYGSKRKEFSTKLDRNQVPIAARAASYQRSTSSETKIALDTDLSMNESRMTSLDTCDRSDVKIENKEKSDMSGTMNHPPRDASDGFSCIMDLPPDTIPRLPNQHSFKTSYRLKKEEINQPSLYLEAPVPGHSNTSYRHTNISHAREKVDLSGLSTKKEQSESSSSYRQAQSVPHSRTTIDRSSLSFQQAPPNATEYRAPSVPHSRTVIDRSSLPSESTPQESRSWRNSPSPSPNRPDMNANRSNTQSPNLPRQSRFDRLIRWVNHRPFFHFDQIFASFPSMFRGFDENGFFFFSMNPNAAPDTEEEQKETQRAATKEEIEKAISQLTGLSSDLEIKKGDSCPICLEQFKTTDDAVQMPCPCKRTFFHRQCAVKTLEMTKKIKCPNCRRWNAN